jgi:polar amino acid transport system substrate-binding protein
VTATLWPRARAELAPGGTLRAAINLGNPTLARLAAGGEPAGVSVDLARALAEQMGLALRLITFPGAAGVVEAARHDAWDIAFLAVDPLRAESILYSPPYVNLEGAYLVRSDSPLTDNAEVDRAGHRVAVGRGSAYDLHLTRVLKQATIVRVDTSQAVTDTFVAQSLEVAAGVRQQLQSDAARLPGLRLLPGHFMRIHQAMATPAGRPEGARGLGEFVEAMKSSGFVADALRRHNIEGAAVAPAAPPGY